MGTPSFRPRETKHLTLIGCSENNLHLNLCRLVHLQTGSSVLVGERGAVAALLTDIQVAALPATDVSTAEGATFTTFALSIQPARRASHLCGAAIQTVRPPHVAESRTVCVWLR